MDYFDRADGGNNAILVHLHLKNLDDYADDLQEFKLLASSAGAICLDTITGTLAKPNAKYFVGTGKADEIRQAVETHNADLVIFNHTLTPSQERNLEKLISCRVLDRTGLILDIFAQRAKTFEGKLQVELAQLTHLSTRLVRGWTHLERQKGGIGLRGPGETQLETDRRLLQIRVGQLKNKLDKVKQTRKQGRSRRQKSDIPTISLVGYTNAGKSTLFNTLTCDNIYAADQLFATLDPTLRSIDWVGVGKVVLADTVGFVRNLPHELVESFHATLEEVLEADLLLHIIDSASDSKFEQIQAVNEVLDQIGNTAPILLVHNKIDKSGEQPSIRYKDSDTPSDVYISAQKNLGLDKLHTAVQALLAGQFHNYTLHISPTNLPKQLGAFKNALYELGIVKSERYDDAGNLQIDIHLPMPKLAQLFGQYNINACDVLSDDSLNDFLPILEEFEKPKTIGNDSFTGDFEHDCL